MNTYIVQIKPLGFFYRITAEDALKAWAEVVTQKTTLRNLYYATDKEELRQKLLQDKITKIHTTSLEGVFRIEKDKELLQSTSNITPNNNQESRTQSKQEQSNNQSKESEVITLRKSNNRYGKNQHEKRS